MIDPVTGLPAEEHWRTVSVSAASCVDANIASTAAIVMGADAPDWLEAAPAPGAARRDRRHGRPCRRMDRRDHRESRVLATSSQTLWYLTRGTGVISLVLLTASVALGVSEVVRFASPGWPRFVLAALHKNVALVATAFVAVHVLTAILDSFASISLVDVLVPFVGSYRPLWLGLGTVALDLLLAVIVTSLLRERIGHRTWRVVHWAAYACWPIAFVHSLGTGTDTRYRWAAALNVACLVAVLIAVLFRLGWTRTVSIGSRTVAALGSAALAFGVVAWMVVEPMRPGWARKAGTPSTLLASARSGTALRRQPGRCRFRSPARYGVRSPRPTAPDDRAL